MNATITREVEQYLRTILWAEIDDQDEPLDGSYDIGDFAPEAIALASADVNRFIAENAADIMAVPQSMDRVITDFWLTRNGHGAGFWDGDYPEPYATRLTSAAHAFGESDAYVGDDGRIYLS